MDLVKPLLKGLFCCALFVLVCFSSLAASVSDTTNIAQKKQDYLRQLIVEEARHFIGMDYRYGGSEPETGFDCSGFTKYLMERYAIPIARSSREQAQLGQEIPLEQVKPGDLITFRRSRKRAVSHVALVVDNNEEGVFIIHSCSRGIVVDNLNESRYWKPKVYLARDVISDSEIEIDLPEPERKTVKKMPLLKRLPRIVYASLESENFRRRSKENVLN